MCVCVCVLEYTYVSVELVGNGSSCKYLVRPNSEETDKTMLINKE